MSHVHTDPDVAAELFMLEPEGEPAQEQYEYRPRGAPREPRTRSRAQG
jgi:hypothetical protein